MNMATLFIVVLAVTFIVIFLCKKKNGVSPEETRKEHMHEEFKDALSLMVITEEGILHYAHSTGAQIARRDKITKIKPGKLLKSLNIDYMDKETKRYFSVTCSNKAEFDRLVKAYEQFSKHVGVPLNKELTPEDFGINLEALLPVPDSKEFRKHCNV